jgi:hypothetical protein
MTLIERSAEGAPGSIRAESPRSVARRVRHACLAFFVIGVIAKIGLGTYLAADRPQILDVAAGRTEALAGHGATVYITHAESYLLRALDFAPWTRLLIALLIHASSWREFK